MRTGKGELLGKVSVALKPLKAVLKEPLKVALKAVWEQLLAQDISELHGSLAVTYSSS